MIGLDDGNPWRSPLPTPGTVARIMPELLLSRDRQNLRWHAVLSVRLVY
ncbi:MAG: hypothetical protein F6K30_28555 [Cyanothece sp. SIO2G6]|nr:hypothetical protein [Cyanothece sp. SIO2G6]